MMKNGPYLFKFSDFFHQAALISKGKHCLLSRHDNFDYSTDFHKFRGFIKEEGGGDFPLLLRHVSPATFD